MKVAALSVLTLAALAAVLGPEMGYTDGNMKVRRTEQTLHALRWAVEEYARVQHGLPDRLAVLMPDYLSADNPLKDGWRRDFVYTPAASAGHPFALSSNGPDGLPGTKDDLDAWTMN